MVLILIMGFLDFLKGEEKPKRKYKSFNLVETEKGEYENFQKSLLEHSLIMLITGKRGSGKSALGMKFLEMFNKKTRKNCYAMGFDAVKIPRWIKKAQDIEKIPNNAVVLADEGGILFFARNAMKNSNKFLSQMMAIARHKNQTLILIAQNSALIELNVLRLADVIILKEPSLLQTKFERKAIKEMYEKLKPKFKSFDNRKKYFYVYSDEFEGFLSHDLASFWNENISKAFKDLK